ncbi:MAG: NAD-dependent epimerase/dehydratase family protein [Ilumatobacteraceae bacterium]
MGDELHVVFGSGPAGRAVATELARQGLTTTVVNRSGRQVLDGVETLGGDVTDPHFARTATDGASTVYFCLNAAHYHRWAQEFPPLQYAVVDATSAAGARLVVLENLYMYGPTGGAPMTESTPCHPTGTTSAVRAQMSDELIDAHRAGRVEVVIGRAADFVGPGVTASAMGEFVFGSALAGKKARTMGRPDTLHSFSYVPDIGRNLVLLGSRADAYGRVWHLPNPPTRTIRDVIIDVYSALDKPARLSVLSKPMLRVVGLFNRDVRELLSTYYQFDAPFISDHSAFTTAFGGHVTAWDDIVQTTLASYHRVAASHVDVATPTP